MYKIDSKVDKPSANYLVTEVTNMMKRGIKIGSLSGLYNACSQDRDEYLRDIQTKYGIVNPNSSVQVIDYLKSLNDPGVVGACVSNGKWTSDKFAMQLLESLGYEVGSDMILYRTAKKYAESIKSMMEAADTKGLIHPSVTLAKTNRISYNSPAIMNIPKALLWDIVVPSTPGNVLISADIKNQEPNILINMNNIKSLMPALSDGGGLYEGIFAQLPILGRMNLIIDDKETPGLMDNMDLNIRGVPPVIYTPKPTPFKGIMVNSKEVKLIDVINFVTPIGVIPELPTTISVITNTSEVFEVPIHFDIDFNQVTNKKKLKSGGIIEVDGTISGVQFNCDGIVRKEFKRAWIAMTYGASKMGVNQICRHIDGNTVYDFFTKIPELQEYRSKCKALASTGSQKISTYFGTELCANEHNKSALKRVLLDLPIQGTAADILSLLVKHFNDETIKLGIQNDIWIYYTRHDELIIEVSERFISEVGVDNAVALITELLEHQVDNWIPFRVDVKPVVSVDISEIVETTLDED